MLQISVVFPSLSETLCGLSGREGFVNAVLLQLLRGNYGGQLGRLQQTTPSERQTQTSHGVKNLFIQGFR